MNRSIICCVELKFANKCCWIAQLNWQQWQCICLLDVIFYIWKQQIQITKLYEIKANKQQSPWQLESTMTLYSTLQMSDIKFKLQFKLQTLKLNLKHESSDLNLIHMTGAMTDPMREILKLCKDYSLSNIFVWILLVLLIYPYCVSRFKQAWVCNKRQE